MGEMVIILLMRLSQLSKLEKKGGVTSSLQIMHHILWT